jgi:riboflavin biosynthesis pyrimidine reductase
MVFAGHHTPPEYLAYLRSDGIPYLLAGEANVDLRIALEKLSGLLGVEAVLSTAGGRLNGALLRAGLIDEVNVEFLPALVGGTNTPSLFSAPDLQEDQWPTVMHLISAQIRDSGSVWIRYRITSDEDNTSRRVT